MTKQEALQELREMKLMWEELKPSGDAQYQQRCGARALELDIAIKIVEQIDEYHHATA